jgi:carboxylate-amine ligase
VRFNPSPRHTVGVEWELQLLDPRTLDLVDGIIPLMEFFPGNNFVKPEFIQSCVELTSEISENSAEATEHLRVSLDATLQRCRELDMSVCGAGTHPFCRRLALITPLPRYKIMVESAGYLAHTQITFSTHVHVGMESGDQAMRAMSYLIPALSAFIALSANSPFWRGHDTGHVAYRHRILAAAANYGLPPRFGNWQEFDSFLNAARRSNMIKTFKDIHWDIRPHPDFGTLELRAMDAASDLQTVHGLVAFARCLILRLVSASTQEVNDVLPANLPIWMEHQNRFRAALRGLDAEYIVDETGNHRPVKDVISDLIEFSSPIAAEIGETQGMKIVRELLNGAPGYRRQLDAYAEGDTARSVVRMLQTSMLR